MTKETLIKRLELAYSCLIGSHTHNYTPQEQFKSIIDDLKQVKNNVDLHNVVNQRELLIAYNEWLINNKITPTNNWSVRDYLDSKGNL